MTPGFICTHLTQDLRLVQPPLVVEHDHPVDETDTGWGVYCGGGPHANAELKIVNLDRYIAQDPALQELVHTLPTGFIARRTASDQPWTIERITPEEEAAPAPAA